MKAYAVRFSVVGSFASGQFPLDMLRYDGCYPADQESVGEMVRATRTWPMRSAALPLFRVRLTAVSLNSKWRPTEARWKSFGWQIEPGSIRLDPLP